MATSAKQSALDTLHRLFIAELTLRLKAGDASAAVLGVIANVLAKSGTKATDDSPKMMALAKSWADLPFKDELPTITHDN
jgi:hypothetical protein